MHIALDAMGGDYGPAVVVPAAIYVMSQHPNLNVTFVGDKTTIENALASVSSDFNTRIQVRHASQVVENKELPSLALKNKKDSSMRVAIEMVKAGEANACVSAGNTGALMATARFVLRMLPGVDRPAICSIMPGMKGNSHMLDLGANVESPPEQLFQFAVMGVALTRAVANKENPTVALLNIGEEDIKGEGRVKQAAALLSNSHLNYVGFVEGNDIYEGTVDVIVCDGFVGNVALKASEGVARMLLQFAKEEFTRTWMNKIAALVARPTLKALRERIDPRNYNGASLLGLRGIVVKSHGGADQVSFATAIEEAIVEVEKDVPKTISHQLEEIFEKRRVS